MSTETAEHYDPIPDLAWLLCSAQREKGTACSKVGARLIRDLGLPELANREEAEAAIRKAAGARP